MDDVRDKLSQCRITSTSFGPWLSAALRRFSLSPRPTARSARRRANGHPASYPTRNPDMYIPSSFRVSDEATILSFIERYDFGTIVTSSASDGIVATHVPILVKRVGTGVVLQGHVARANGHWRDFDGRTQALAIFQGPHGYVSPTWYTTAPRLRPAPCDRGPPRDVGYPGGPRPKI